MKLIFVYNADGGVFSSLKDVLYKVVRPKTYECNLCMVTYGPVSMRKEWKMFINSFDVPIEFLHRDEFHEKYSNKDKLPAVFKEKNGKLSLFISAKKINKAKSVKDLIKLVRNNI